MNASDNYNTFGGGGWGYVNNYQLTVGGSTNAVATWPVQIVNPPSLPEDEFGWLKRRVREITDLVAVA